MSLSLKVPELSDKPLIIAETRPSKISDFIAKLQQNDLPDTASLVYEELEILNRQKVSAEDRMRALEVYRPMVVKLCGQLAEQYCNASLPLSEHAKAHAGLAESLWLELSYGYKLALLDTHKKFFSLNSEKTTALTIQRALDAMRELAMVYHQTYFTLPNSLWLDLNQLYLYAAQQSLHQINVAEDSAPTNTITLTYKKTLLMALADPQRLSVVDIKRVADYISRHADHAHLQGLGLIDKPAGIFFISLKSDLAPVGYNKNKKEGDAKHDIFLNTVDLARLVHKHIGQLKSEPIEESHELPIEASEPGYLEMLTYLIKHWSEPPRRVFDRNKKNEGVEIAVGMSALHFFCQTDKKKLDTSEPSSAAIKPEHNSLRGTQQFSSSRWIVLNLSASGIALRKPANIKESLSVGSLLCIRDSTAKHWSVGVVRWAANNEHHQIDIGTQLIAPTAKPIYIHKPSETGFEKALMLPGITVLKQAASIIAPNGMYSQAGQLEIEESGKLTRIIITRLVERTTSFDHFNFSYL